MTDEKFKVSKAPPPITPIRGNSYVPQKPKDERLPRWNKWRLIPEVKKWEAIALSLNIEPDKIKTSSTAWMGAEHPFDEGEEFNDRLAVLRANSGRANFPTPCTLNMGEWYSCGVRLNEFASWALSVAEWGLPPKLAEMAQKMDIPDDKPSTVKVEAVHTSLPKKQLSQTWWRVEYDIMTMAQSAGDSLRRKTQQTSNRAIGDFIALEIETREKAGKKRKAPDGQTIKNTDLRGWKYKAE